MMYYYGGDFGSFHAIGFVLMVAFWAAVIYAVVYAIRSGSRRTCGHDHGEHGGRSRAMEILKERYARSEISKEEFEAKRKDLE